MSNVGQVERHTQSRVLKLFKSQIGYEYLGNWEDRPNNQHIEKELLVKYLRSKSYPEQLLQRAVFEFEKTAGDQTKTLYDVNKEVYNKLRYGVKLKPSVGENTETVELIDWKYPLKNHFAFAEEVTIEGENNKRPDVVLYINGIAIGVLELKRSTISISEGIRQNIDSQKKIFIRRFFSTMQLVMAGNDTEGLRYGTIETPEKYYLTWKEESDVENLLDKGLLLLCNKERLIELLHDFVVYDRGVKKLCRHNQYFGVKRSQDHISRREGGIIWHSQGSGKSLTMVWLTRWIHENVTNARVLIITDREELDEQIEKVFTGVSETIYRTKSGKDLLEKLDEAKPWLLCSLVHKFGSRAYNEDDPDYTEYLEELKRSIPSGFKPKGDLYVFVDECHRTQSGELHKAMKAILPNALFIGFTGTPLLRKDKKSSLEVFGKYIHTYKFDEAVRDEVVLDLLYEARNVEQYLTSESKIDQWFETKTRGLNDYQKSELKKRWGTMQKVLSSRDRLQQIVNDIVLDMNTKARLMSGHGNAILISGSIYQACKYYELFQQTELKDKCSIITSYKPNISDTKGEGGDINAVTEKLHQYEVYKQMLGDKTTETFEKDVKKQFIEEPAQMKLLIVVDKLLTGFDAPPATYLYIDKKMQDHGLFQAICRVNRLDGDDKEYGYIVDYKDLFDTLSDSIHDYTSEAFDDYEQEDVDGLLTDRLEKAKERLDEALESLHALCEPVSTPRDSLSFIHFFCGNTENKDDLVDTEQTRRALYKQTVSLIRAYANIANEMNDAGYSSGESEAIKQKVIFYTNLRDEIKRASGESIDLKAYEPDMRYLIDAYIRAHESEKISAFDDISLVELLVERGIDALQSLPEGIRKNKEAMAETIENNIRRLIIEDMPTNPKYYSSMSSILDELVKLRNQEAIDYSKYLDEIVALCKKLTHPEKASGYPRSLDTKAKRALFDNLNRNENLTVVLNNEILTTRKDNWRGNRIKEREVLNAIRKHIYEETEVERIFDLVKNQNEY